MEASAPRTPRPGARAPIPEVRPALAPEPPPRPGDPADLVTVPSRQGLEAVDILRRHTAESVGPVLHDDDHDTLSFLVPWGTAEAWDVPGSDCTHADCAPPGPGHEEHTPLDGTDWLVPPGESEPLTDPAVLRAALGEAARTIEAADNCR